MHSLRQDLRFALRTLRRAPAVTLLVVGSLALAIGGNTTVFSLVNGLLYRPMPYHQPDRVALVGEYEDPIAAGTINPTSAANFVDWRERQRSFSAMAAYTSAPAKLGGDERGEPVEVAAVTPEFFPLLGNEARLGRTFLAEEGTPGNHRVAILTHGFWQRRFAADAGIVGRTFDLDGEPYTVVGVLPESFEFFDPRVELWRPLALDPARLSRQRRDLLVLGRLKPGVTTAAADAEMKALGEQLAAEYPDANRGYTVEAVNLREQVPDSRNRQLFALLQGALVFVLLIACANIANLLLARAQGRVTEIAVRSSLGAGRGRIVRQLATESLVMAGAGGLLGLGLGALGTELMTAALVARVPRFLMPIVDARVVLFTAGITVLGALLFGLVPALQVARLNVQSALKEGGRGTTLGGRRRLLSKGLVVAEIALALVLLGGASVLIRSFLDLQHTDPGFETAHLLVLRVTLPESGYATDPDRTAGVEELARRLEGLPGATAVAASDLPPRTPGLPTDTFTIDAAPPPDGQAPPSAAQLAVSPGFFAAVGVPLGRGRLFEAADRPEAAPVVIVNQALARRFWPDGDPLGQQLTVRGRSRRIVGVVGDVAHTLFVRREAQPSLYLPLAQEPRPAVFFSLRTAGDPAGLVNPVRETILAYDAGLVVDQLQPLDQFAAQFYVGMQIFTTILGGFGSLALLLAALGTYGVLAYAVAQRSHEIGVRMAIGARRGQVMRMVVRQGLTLAAVGLVLGVPGVLLVNRLIAGALSDLVALKPATIAAVAAVLAAVTLLASWMPARRAAAVDPVVALRME